MEFKTLVQARRSVRSFDATEVTDEQIAAIIDAGLWAPSPLNLQPWKFIVVSDPEIKKQIKEVAEAAKQEVMDNEGPGWVAKYSMDWLLDAPVFIIVVADPKKSGLGSFFGQGNGAIQAASACVQNMMLAAADMGLGSIWFTFFRPEKLKELLNVPENLDIAAVLPVGTPKDPAKAPPRKEATVYSQKYGSGS